MREPVTIESRSGTPDYIVARLQAGKPEVVSVTMTDDNVAARISVSLEDLVELTKRLSAQAGQDL